MGPIGLFLTGKPMSKGDETRNRILESSVNLFNQHGFAGTSLSDIMAATGLRKGGIYRHFDSKDQLALATFDHTYTRLRQHYLRRLRGVRGAVARLDAIVSAFGELAEGSPLLGGCPILNTAVDSDDTHPLLLAKARQAMDDWMALWVSVIESGQARGEIKPEIEATEEAAGVIASLEGSLVLARIYDDPHHLNHIKAALHRRFETDLAA
jgi:TetR/AcrR family transcriptional repressor of nem operon